MMWGLRFMLENGGTPCGWRTKWRADMKLQIQDGGVEFHESACRMLQVGSSYDQLNLGNVAMAEMLMREVMCTEEKYKDRAGGVKDGSLTEKSLFLGLEQRVNLCIHPELLAYIGEEMRKEAIILKERRKAREERVLLKPEKEKKWRLFLHPNPVAPRV